MTDDAIMTLTRNPDTLEEGYRQLVKKYQERLYYVIYRRMSSHEDTDDVLQNTFIKVFRYLDGFEGRSELYTWMYRIALNEVSNQRKSLKRNKMVELDPNDTKLADAFVNMDDLTAALETSVSKLPERQQMVFRMRYYDELSYKQMAEMLQLTEGALKASFHHAAKKIEEELKAKQIV